MKNKHQLVTLPLQDFIRKYETDFRESHELQQFDMDGRFIPLSSSKAKVFRRYAREQFFQNYSQYISFGQNKDMENYLRGNHPMRCAINDEITHKTRNFFIVRKTNNHFEICGYFALSIKIVGISQLKNELKKEILLSGKGKTVEYIPVIFIAQFGKNTFITDNPVNSKVLFEHIFPQLVHFQRIVGGKMVFLDSVVTTDNKIQSMYETLGFRAYGEPFEDTSGNQILQPMGLDYSNLSSIVLAH